MDICAIYNFGLLWIVLLQTLGWIFAYVSAGYVSGSGIASHRLGVRSTLANVATQSSKAVELIYILYWQQVPGAPHPPKHLILSAFLILSILVGV